MISTLDRCLCENLELKDKIESNFSYAAVLKNNNIQSTTKIPEKQSSVIRLQTKKHGGALQLNHQTRVRSCDLTV